MRTLTKKRKRIWIGALITITLVFVAIGLFLFLRPDQEELNAFKDQIAQEAGEITQSLQAQIQQVTEESRTQARESEAQAEPPADASGNTGAGSETEPQLTAAQKQQLEAALAQRYRSILEDLKHQATGMLSGVLAQAQGEYNALVASGKKNPETLGTLATEYMAKVDVMEAQMDASFDTLIQDMEAQLKSQGIDGAAIISKFRSEYHQVKEANRQAFMDKAWEVIS